MRQPLRRFIPAGAGNTRKRFQGRSWSPVHPRWRGEHSTAASSRSSYPGSSPLARGTQGLAAFQGALWRFIPAGAGNTTIHGQTQAGTSGSSPLARGTRTLRTPGRLTGRFIPAGAGNTNITVPALRSTSVHPRWRGEHGKLAGVHPHEFGSSPLARGTLDLPSC